MDDLADFSEMTISSGFREAVRDYRWLLDRGYPCPGSLKLTGDRYALGKDERNALFRGVLSAADSKAGRDRLAPVPDSGISIAVDGYCVALTIFHYRRGRPLFIATDGFLRDAGGSHGHIPDDGLFGDILGLVGASIIELCPLGVEIVFDAPVSRSADHACAMRSALGEASFPVSVRLERSADAVIVLAAEGVIATSDSAIIRKARVPTFDLARYILETRYDARFVDFSGFLA